MSSGVSVWGNQSTIFVDICIPQIVGLPNDNWVEVDDGYSGRTISRMIVLDDTDTLESATEKFNEVLKEAEELSLMYNNVYKNVKKALRDLAAKFGYPDDADDPYVPALVSRVTDVVIRVVVPDDSPVPAGFTLTKKAPWARAYTCTLTPAIEYDDAGMAVANLGELESRVESIFKDVKRYREDYVAQHSHALELVKKMRKASLGYDKLRDAYSPQLTFVGHQIRITCHIPGYSEPIIPKHMKQESPAHPSMLSTGIFVDEAMSFKELFLVLVDRVRAIDVAYDKYRSKYKKAIKRTQDLQTLALQYMGVYCSSTDCYVFRAPSPTYVPVSCPRIHIDGPVLKVIGYSLPVVERCPEVMYAVQISGKGSFMSQWNPLRLALDELLEAQDCFESRYAKQLSIAETLVSDYVKKG